MSEIRIVARNSKLSQQQVKEVVGLFPDAKFQFQWIESFGDRHQEVSLIDNSIPDFFTRELDQYILNNQADIAIHSAKDLPYPIPKGLSVVALTEGLDQKDALVSKNKTRLEDLPPNSRIGTSSNSRKQQILSIRPDLNVVSVRGTIEMRLQLIEQDVIDALVVAQCALERLGIEYRASQILPFETHALQGKLAVLARTGDQDLVEFFIGIDSRIKYGKVTIAGFGPGNPGLITLMAFDALKNAQVIYHDDLVDIGWLGQFSAEKVYVGKRFGKHSHSQAEINQLLYQSAKEGKTVVRLKGGDPFIFGRGGEEYDYLRERLVDVKVIPGVSSANGAAAFTGIPLTHRDWSSSVAFCTGFPDDQIQFPNADTLVYYMGINNLAKIVNGLLENGLSAYTQIVVVCNATMINQKVIYSELGKILSNTNEIETPAILIIGKVVVDKNITLAKNVLVTGTDSGKYTHLGQIVHTPLIEISEGFDINELKTLLNENFDYLIFTSRYTVSYFFKALFQLGKDARCLHQLKIVSIGKTTSEALKDKGIVADLQPMEESSNGILKLFNDLRIVNARILLPRSDQALNILPEGLSRLGNWVNTLVVYKNQIPTLPRKVDLNEIDTIVFTSPSTIRNFIKIYGSIPKTKKLITRGIQTESELKKWLNNTTSIN